MVIFCDNEDKCQFKACYYNDQTDACFFGFVGRSSVYSKHSKWQQGESHVADGKSCESC